MGSTLIHNVRIFDGESVISWDGYILFENGLIKEIGTESWLPHPDADIVLDGEGNTILPGFIDAHVHVYGGVYELEQALKFGVTTVLDLMNEPDSVQALKKAARERPDIADIRSALHGATVEGGWPSQVLLAISKDLEVTKKQIDTWPKLKGPEDAEAYVKKYKDLGADYIKLYQECGSTIRGESMPTPTLELQAAVVKAAHEHGLITVAHALSLEDTLTVLKAGTDGMAHTFYDKAPTEELLQMYKKNNSFLVPTLVASATLIGEEEESTKQHMKHELVGQVLNESGKTCFCGRMRITQEGCKSEYAYETVKMVKKQGLDIICGTDTSTGFAGTAFGLSVHQELSLLSKRCDLTPAEALKSATSTTARRFGMKDRGRLAKGLRADVLMVKGDPTADISCTMNITGVWRGGVALKR